MEKYKETESCKNKTLKKLLNINFKENFILFITYSDK